MQWYWIDRFVEFQSGRRATAVKLITLSERHLHDHFPYYPIMPNSLVVEGLGQTGMLLAWEAIRYSQLVLLAKVTSARFYLDAVPGDSLTYTVVLNSIRPEGISASAVSRKNDRLQGEAELLFTRFSTAQTDRDGDSAALMAKMMRLLGAFSVGRAEDGSRLTPPNLP